MISQASPPTRAVLALVLGIALTLRLAAASNDMLRPWDEAHHALVAKNLAEHPLHPTLIEDTALPHDDRDWQRAHTWVHKPPLALWAMAASIAAFGPTPLAARLPSALLDTLAVLLTYAIGRRLFGERAALLAAAAHALLGNALLLICGFHPTDHVDLQLSFWVELSAFCALLAAETGRRRWLVALGLSTAGALMSKSYPGLLPIAIYALAAPGSRGRRFVEAGAAGLLAFLPTVPWALHLRARWPELQALVAQDQIQHLWTAAEGHDGHPLYHLEKLGEMHGVLVYLPVAWFLWKLRRGDWRHRFVAAWWIVPFAAFSLSPTKMMNYLAPAAPAVCLMVGLFLEQALETTATASRRWAGLAVAVALLVATGRDLTRSLRPVPGALDFRTAMAALPPRTVVLNVRPFLQAMYFGAHAAYPEVWDAEQRASAEAKGFRVLVACSEPGLSLPSGFCERAKLSLR